MQGAESPLCLLSVCPLKQAGLPERAGTGMVKCIRQDQTIPCVLSDGEIMRIEKIVVGQLDVNCYIISDDAKQEALIIDPGDEAEKIIEYIDTIGLKPQYILFTHAHYDHVCAVKELHDQYKAIIVMHEDEKPVYQMTKQLCISWGYEPEDFPAPERTVRDGDTISIGAISFQVMHTPGHSPGSICIYGENVLFTGDTLFQGSVGRTDLPGGDSELLSRSLKRLLLLPSETRVFCGHGSETSLADEMRNNPFMKEMQPKKANTPGI